MKYIALTLITAFILGCYGKAPVVKTGLEGKPLPSFELLLQDSTTHFNTDMIKQGQPFLLYSFATWCPFCKVQTEEMINNIEDFKGVNIYMITNSSFGELKKFREHFNLGKYDNITTGIDTHYYFAGYFNTNVVPYFAIYDKDKKLKRVLAGKSSIKILSDMLHE